MEEEMMVMAMGNDVNEETEMVVGVVDVDVMEEDLRFLGFSFNSLKKCI